MARVKTSMSSADRRSGPSGSGKSTLVSLIPRFYDPISGVVAIDGHDVKSVTVKSVRRQVGFVLQDTQLFYAPVWQVEWRRCCLVSRSDNLTLRVCCVLYRRRILPCSTPLSPPPR